MNFGSDAGRAVQYAMTTGSGDFIVSAVALNKVLRSLEPLSRQGDYIIIPLVDSTPKYNFVKKENLKMTKINSVISNANVSANSNSKVYLRLFVSPAYLEDGTPWDSYLDNYEVIPAEVFEQADKTLLDATNGVYFAKSGSIEDLSDENLPASTEYAAFIDSEDGTPKEILVELPVGDFVRLTGMIASGIRPYVGYTC